LRWLYDTNPRQKADGSEITEADRAAEEVIVEGLQREFPHSAIVGEEGAHVEGSRGTWHVDPIDGTSAFVEGLAHWGPTVALVQDGALRVGAFYQPRMDELWFAARGAGAWRDETRLEPEPMASIGRNDSLYLPSRFHRTMPLPWTGKVRALGCTAAHLAFAASGGAAAAVVARWAMWDIGCGVLLVSEAHRALLDLTGAPFDPMQTPGAAFVAGDPLAVRQVVDNLFARPPTGVQR